MMNTISKVFVTGVKEITTTPALFGDVLEYEMCIRDRTEGTAEV